MKRNPAVEAISIEEKDWLWMVLRRCKVERIFRSKGDVNEPDVFASTKDEDSIRGTGSLQKRFEACL